MYSRTPISERQKNNHLDLVVVWTRGHALMCALCISHVKVVCVNSVMEDRYVNMYIYTYVSM